MSETKMEANCLEFVARTIHERVRSCVFRHMRDVGPAHKAFVGPESWDVLLQMLVATHDPTLRAEWDGPRCYLRIAMGGRELVIHAREGMEEGAVEVQ